MAGKAAGLGLVLGLGLGACSSPAVAGAGSDAGTSDVAPHDASKKMGDAAKADSGGHDAHAAHDGRDAHDAGRDASKEGGHDAGQDSASDAGTEEAATDAAPEDAGSAETGNGDAGTEAGTLFACGSTTCNSATEYCEYAYSPIVKPDSGPSIRCESVDAGCSPVSCSCIGQDQGPTTTLGGCGCYTSDAGAVTFGSCPI